MTEHIVVRLRQKAMSEDFASRKILNMAADLLEHQKKELVEFMAEMAAKQKILRDLKEENEIIKKERDLLLKQLEAADVYCQFCKGTDPNAPCEKVNGECSECFPGCRCKDCNDADKWEWKGVDE